MIDVVVGYAKGYNAEQIRPFLKSLRESGYDKKILLFVNGEAAKEAEKWDVDIRPVPPLKVKVHSDRFICLLDALTKEKCQGILMADTRDIIFQKNPSEYLPSKRLNVYEEDQSMSIGTCPYNSLWIKLAYGEEVLKEMKDEFISCVGTVCGGYASITYYLKNMVSHIEKIQPKTNKPQDQAIHNYLIRKSLDCRVWHNEEGEVYTVGYIQRGQVKIKDNKVINQSGDIPTVIHQWDRHRNIKNLVKVTL